MKKSENGTSDDTNMSAPDNFRDIYALSFILDSAIIGDGFAIPKDFEKFCPLNSSGKELLEKLNGDKLRAIGPSPEGALAFLALKDSSRLDEYLDLKSISIQGLTKIISKSIIDKDLKYAWVYDRVLYDRFFSLFPGNPETLIIEQVINLLEGSEQGVYQYNDKVIGPLGILPSTVDRWLPPKKSAPLWHCTDTSCLGLHPVEFRSMSPALSQARQDFKSLAIEASPDSGRKIEANIYFKDKLGFYNDQITWDLVWLLGNSFSQSELRAVLTCLLRENSKTIRPILSKLDIPGVSFHGDVDGIVANLSKAQALQICLMVDDGKQIRAVERAIYDELIRIPATEVRVAYFSGSRKNHFRVRAYCSQLGVSFLSTNDQCHVSRTKALINHIYIEGLKSDLLDWKLRFVDGESIDERLDAYLHSAEPIDIIRDLILCDRSFFESAKEYLGDAYYPDPKTSDAEDYLIRKILWKLGFATSQYPEAPYYLKARLSKLENSASNLTSFSELQKEGIRSSSINFFVSLEEALELSLSYVTWVLLSDHYLETKFRFNVEEARHFSMSLLKQLGEGLNTPVEFDDKGKNTLFPLIQGFSILANHCRNLLEEGSPAYQRPTSQYPGFAMLSKVKPFPFKHKILLFDLKSQEMVRLCDELESISQRLDAGQIGNLRNRLGHKRSDFPTSEDIAKGCSLLREVIEGMERSGIYPVVYCHTSTVSDRYERDIAKLHDYCGREVQLNLPARYPACGLPEHTTCQTVFQMLHVGDSGEPLRFHYVEPSEFVSEWKNYPLRQRVLLQEEQ